MDIFNGVMDAKAALPKGVVVPLTSKQFQTIESGVSNCQAVRFEVVVRVDEQKGKAAKLSVVAGVFGGSLADNSSKDSGHSGTLQFSVPMRFPVTSARNEEA